jgi:hypothetical protein
MLNAYNTTNKNSPLEGQMWYNATEKRWKYFDGTDVIDILGATGGRFSAGTFAAPTKKNPYRIVTGSRVLTVFYKGPGTVMLPSPKWRKDVVVYNTGHGGISITPSNGVFIVRDGFKQPLNKPLILDGGPGRYVHLITDGICWVTLDHRGNLMEGK